MPHDHTNAITEALLKAGYPLPPPAEIQLLAIATEAWAKWPEESGKAARRDFVAQRVEDEDLTWLLVERSNPGMMYRLIWDLLTSVKPVARGQRRIPIQTLGVSPAGEGHHESGTHGNHALAPSSHAPHNGAVGGHQVSDTHLSSAAGTFSPDAGQPTADRRSAEATQGTITSSVTPPAATTSADGRDYQQEWKAERDRLRAIQAEALRREHLLAASSGQAKGIVGSAPVLPAAQPRDNYEGKIANRSGLGLRLETFEVAGQLVWLLTKEQAETLRNDQVAQARDFSMRSKQSTRNAAIISRLLERVRPGEQIKQAWRDDLDTADKIVGTMEDADV